VCFTHTHVEPGSDTPLSDNFSQSYSYGRRRTRFDHLVVFAIDYGDSDVPFYKPSPFGDIVSVLRRSSGYEELDGSNVDRRLVPIRQFDGVGVTATDPRQMLRFDSDSGTQGLLQQFRRFFEGLDRLGSRRHREPGQ
jgi:hypothetical protein